MYKMFCMSTVYRWYKPMASTHIYCHQTRIWGNSLNALCYRSTGESGEPQNGSSPSLHTTLFPQVIRAGNCRASTWRPRARLSAGGSGSDGSEGDDKMAAPSLVRGAFRRLFAGLWGSGWVSPPARTLREGECRSGRRRRAARGSGQCSGFVLYRSGPRAALSLWSRTAMEHCSVSPPPHHLLLFSFLIFIKEKWVSFWFLVFFSFIFVLCSRGSDWRQHDHSKSLSLLLSHLQLVLLILLSAEGNKPVGSKKGGWKGRLSAQTTSQPVKAKQRKKSVTSVAKLVGHTNGLATASLGHHPAAGEVMEGSSENYPDLLCGNTR